MPRLAFLLIACAALVPGTTLERLTLEQMAEKATAIVRGRVVGSSTSTWNSIISTTYTVAVAETLKGPDTQTVQVSVPGGVAGGVRHSFPGTPDLASGDEYVFFLWTGKSGRTQIIGLSQGVFQLQADAKGSPSVLRSASTETMLDPATGAVITDTPIRMPYSELARRVRNALEGRAAR